LDPVGFVYLGVMVLTWAGNWPLMKLALGQVPPLVFVLLRLIGSLILIAPALLATGQSLLPPRGERLTLFWVGQLQVAGFLICSIIGLAILPAGRAIVLAYPNRRFRAVNADLRRRGDSRCCAQHCINRRRDSCNPATVILTRLV
jgi:hypothetical protein